ncbi:MAG: DUF935 family protein [Desulfobacterales bacterium]|nr:DUF935 family protein [Desulfobacterales bacterium]
MAKKVKTEKPITDEIATTAKDIDIFAGWLNRLENPDPTLRTEAGGKGLKLYDEVDRDSHAGSVLQTRYLAVVGKEWEVLAADDSDASGKIADAVKSMLLSCNFTQACQELLQAILYGFFVSEVMWSVVRRPPSMDRGKSGNGQWTTNNGQPLIIPAKIMGKHPRRFMFDMERSLRLLTPQNMIDGEAVPDRKFIVFTCGSSDNPYGKGLGQKLWWPVWFKKNGIKFWLMFLEKFGMPTVKGKYPPGTPPDQQQALLDAIDALQNETGIKIPNTMELELMEATRQGRVTYETLAEYMDKQMSKAVLGQTATTEGTPGKLGGDEAQGKVRQDILKADADLLCECLNSTLVRWIVDYNFPGVTDYPKLWIRTDAEQDLKALADRDKILVNDIGLPVGRKYFYETYAIPEPEEDENSVAGGDAPVPSKAAALPAGAREFAETGDLSPADTLAALGDKTLAEANLDDLMAPIERLLGSVETLEEFRDRLLEVYSDMDASSLGDLMQKALTLADLSGRFDVGER